MSTTSPKQFMQCQSCECYSQNSWNPQTGVCQRYPPSIPAGSFNGTPLYMHVTVQYCDTCFEFRAKGETKETKETMKP